VSAAQPFQPKGDRAEWQMIYEDLLLGAEFGDVVTLADLNRVLGRDFRKSRSPLYRARKAFAAERGRWLTAVPRVGYRVIEAREHMTHANDVTRLTPDELKRFDGQAKVNALLFSVAVQHERRLNSHEDALRRAGML
jgi:DNA-binding winged helix-turn-helix (wHTH) protein